MQKVVGRDHAGKVADGGLEQANLGLGGGVVNGRDVVEDLVHDLSVAHDQRRAQRVDSARAPGIPAIALELGLPGILGGEACLLLP